MWITFLFINLSFEKFRLLLPISHPFSKLRSKDASFQQVSGFCLDREQHSFQLTMQHCRTNKMLSPVLLIFPSTPARFTIDCIICSQPYLSTHTKRAKKERSTMGRRKFIAGTQFPRVCFSVFRRSTKNTRK